MDRRAFLIGGGAAAAWAWAAPALPAETQDALFDDLEARTFRFFWETTNPANGLAPDRWPDPPFCSIAAVGFALTAYGIGVERGWVSRAAARRRVLATLRFFHDAPQGSGARGVTGDHGFFYHFLDMGSGERFETIELSTVDTSLLLAGVLFCQSYFAEAHPEEAEIRRLAEAIYGRVDWTWAQQPEGPAIGMGWTPEHGFIPYSWRGYNEGMIVYLLALGSPTHPVGTDAWGAWQRDFDKSWGLNDGPLPHVGFPPMFGHQYTETWVDLRGIRDGYMRARGIDYFENSRRATLAQHAYARANPLGWKAYGEEIWGLTACDGPGDFTHAYRGEPRKFRGYSARGPDRNDDGTLAPTAVAGSLPFAPEICAPAVRALKRDYGRYIYGRYGFLDAFNPSFDFDDLQPHTGRRVPGVGWIAPQYLGIDQGPIVAMIENWRSGFVWKVMRRNPHIRRGLIRAGFTGGWLERA